MMNFDDKIKELKIKLPEAKAPVGSYVATKIVGKYQQRFYDWSRKRKC